jgi:rhamnogalacturonyl hydrolase YesR
MGASMTRAARNKIGPDQREVIDRFATYVHTKQFRLEDGLLARKSPYPKSIWLDDAYMGAADPGAVRRAHWRPRVLRRRGEADQGIS